MSPAEVSRQRGSLARSLASARTLTPTVRACGSSRSAAQQEKRRRLRMKQLVRGRVIIGEDRDVVVGDFSFDERDGDVIERFGEQARVQGPGPLDDLADIDALGAV